MDGVFEKVLREAIPGLPAGEPLLPDAPLAGYGLDSLGMVRLAAELEAAYGPIFDDRTLSPGTFRDAGTLWGVVSTARGPR